MTGRAGKRRLLYRVLAAAGLVAALLYLANASWLWGAPGRPTLLAHRGLAQQFDRKGLTNRTCTAERMLAPAHPYLENTLAGIAAAVRLGADMVEIDVHPTTDGEFAVFHDWTLDCRTDGQGVTRRQSMAYLKTLDIGHGYTADGGRTFPFRGRFRGAMPTLSEVIAAFPTLRLLVNVKSDRAREGDQLADYLARRRIDHRRLTFFGAERPMARLSARIPAAQTASKARIRRCLMQYLALGWSGHVPGACRNSLITVPINYRYLVWGWPNLFAERLERADSLLFAMGPLGGGAGGTGLDDPALLATLGDGYRGGIMTDRIDRIGPAVRAMGTRRE